MRKYIQKGRFATTVGTKKHPQLSRRNPKRTVFKNRQELSLLRRNWVIQVLYFNGEILRPISPAKQSSKFESIMGTRTTKAPIVERDCKVYDKMPNWKEREREVRCLEPGGQIGVKGWEGNRRSWGAYESSRGAHFRCWEMDTSVPCQHLKLAGPTRFVVRLVVLGMYYQVSTM